MRKPIYLAVCQVKPAIFRMSRRTCFACHNSISSSAPGKYCYLHQQLYDSLRAEYDALKKTSKGPRITWKQFLTQRANERSSAIELRQVIKKELENA